MNIKNVRRLLYLKNNEEVSLSILGTLIRANAHIVNLLLLGIRNKAQYLTKIMAL